MGIDFEAEKTDGLQESEEPQPKDNAAWPLRILTPPENRAATGRAETPQSRCGRADKPATDNRPRIDYGSTVHVGTELAYIDDTRYKAQFQQAQAALDRAIADLGQLEAKAIQAAAELRRAEQLREFSGNAIH